MTSDPALEPLLAEVPPPVTESEAARLARVHFGLEGEVRRLTGERDANFVLRRADGRRFVVKFAHPRESFAESDLQSEVLLHLEVAAPDLPLPRLVRPLTVDAHQVTVAPEVGAPRQLRAYTYLDGTPAHSGTDGWSFATALGALAAGIDIALVDFSHPADGRMIDWDLRRLPALAIGDVSPEIAAVVEMYNQYARAPLSALADQVVHNDLNPYNVLVSKQQRGVAPSISGVLDFGDMIRAPRLVELATAAAYQIRSGGQLWRDALAIAQGYHAVNPLDRDELVLLPTLIAMRVGLSVTINGQHARQQSENAPYLMRNQTSTQRALSVLSRLDLEQAGEMFAREIGRR